MGIYVLVARTRASAVFYPGDSFSLNYTIEGRPPFTLTFRTTYATGFDIPAPKDFLVEAKGPAEGISDAASTFGNAALNISALIAISVNASMGLLEPELIFDATPDVKEHEFMQSCLPTQALEAVPDRRVDVEVVDEIVSAIGQHPEKDRLLRAIFHYVEALDAWQPGRSISCLAHLYMGVEALTKAVLRQHLTREGKSKRDLAREWGVESKRLQSETRRRLIFGSDDDCYKKARQVSDGFEHGFSDFGDIRKPAAEVISQTATYLRRAILEMLPLRTEVLQRLLSHAVPSGPIKLVRYLHGTLVGRAEQLAAPDEPFPFFRSQVGLKAVFFNEKGSYSFRNDQSFTPKIGEGVTFKPRRFEVWDGSKIVQAIDRSNAAQLRAEPEEIKVVRETTPPSKG